MNMIPASQARVEGLNHFNPFARERARRPDAADLFLLEAEHVAERSIIGHVEIEVTQTVITTVRVRVAA